MGWWCGDTTINTTTTNYNNNMTQNVQKKGEKKQPFLNVKRHLAQKEQWRRENGVQVEVGGRVHLYALDAAYKLDVWVLV